MMSNSESRKRQAEVCEPKCHGFGIGCGCNPNPSQQTIAVKVTVDTDELREWAGKHADSGHHGVAHVLYKAASDGESLTDQAIREAVEQARAEVNAGLAAAVEALHYEHSGSNMSGLMDADALRDLLTADHTAALDAVKAEAAREALLAAADAAWQADHAAGHQWLRARAERHGGGAE